MQNKFKMIETLKTPLLLRTWKVKSNKRERGARVG